MKLMKRKNTKKLTDVYFRTSFLLLVLSVMVDNTAVVLFGMANMVVALYFAWRYIDNFGEEAEDE